MTKGWKDPLLLSAAAGLLAAAVPEAFGAHLRLSPEVASFRKPRKGGKRAESKEPSLWIPEKPRVSAMFGGGNPFAEKLKTPHVNVSEGGDDGGASGGDPHKIPRERGGRQRTRLPMPPPPIPPAVPEPRLPQQGSPSPPDKPETIYATVGWPRGGATGTGAENPPEEDPYSLPFDAITPSAPRAGPSSSSGKAGATAGPGSPNESIYAVPYDVMRAHSTGGGSSSSSEGAGGASAEPQGQEPIYAQPMKKRQPPGTGQGTGGGEDVFKFPGVQRALEEPGAAKGSPPVSAESPGESTGIHPRDDWRRSTIRSPRPGRRGQGGRGLISRQRYNTGTRYDVIDESSGEEGSPPRFKPPPPLGKH
ncbi:hypothetical protein Emag_000144 [Eimeria magna]